MNKDIHVIVIKAMKHIAGLISFKPKKHKGIPTPIPIAPRYGFIKSKYSQIIEFCKTSQPPRDDTIVTDGLQTSGVEYDTAPLY